MLYKGIIHLHTYFSYDSILKPEKIVSIAERNNLNFLIVTDHETVNGSLAVKNIVKERDLEIDVPLAAEYKTSNGDMIAVFIKKEIKNMEFEDFYQEVKGQGGIILFPHPFKGHINIDYLVQKSELIEVFNSRVSEKNNNKAKRLAEEYKIPEFAGSDAHLAKEIDNTIISINYEGTLKEALLSGDIEILKNQRSKHFDIIASQYIKAIKKRDIPIFLSQSKALMYHIWKRDIFKKVN